MKHRSRPDFCEVKIDDAWRPASLDEVLKSYRLAMKRCPECHGSITLYGSYQPGMKPFLTHHRKHTGCSLIPEVYSGIPSPHPKAMV